MEQPHIPAWRKLGLKLAHDKTEESVVNGRPTPEAPVSDKKPDPIKSVKREKNVNTTSSTSSPAVDYLQCFHSCRSNWKFNKARQNQIFKQAFDVSKIPPDFEEALLLYIDGLQSKSGRNNLRERALKIRKEDEEEFTSEASSSKSDHTKDMDKPGAKHGNRASTDEERQKTAYQNALRRFKKTAKWDIILDEEEELQLTSDWEHRLKRRERAEKLLQRLGEAEEGIELKDTAKTPQREKTGIDYSVTRSTTATKRKRQRKRRTAMPDDDSSETESDSSSDSDSDAEATVKRLKTLQEKNAKSIDAAVSSDSSDGESSSSEDEEDTDSKSSDNSTSSEDDNSEDD